MIGMSDVLQVMGAMVIFSLVLLNVNRFLLVNDKQETSAEIEQAAVTHAQDLIERARMLPFDKATSGGATPSNIPDDFTSCGPGFGENQPSDFNDFDDYEGYTNSVDTKFGEFNTSVKVCYVTSADYSSCTTTKTTHKRMQVTVSSPYLDNDINMSYVRTFY